MGVSQAREVLLTAAAKGNVGSALSLGEQLVKRSHSQANKLLSCFLQAGLQLP